MHSQQSLAVALVAAIGACAPQRAGREAAPLSEETAVGLSESERPGRARLDLACDAVASVERRSLVLRSPEVATTLTEALAEGPLASPTGDLMVWTETIAKSGATVMRGIGCANGGWGRPITLVQDRACPDRMAFSPDGGRIAYVSTSRGIAAIFVVDSDGGRPAQLTNVGVARSGREPGKAPRGFVPVPHDSPLQFDGALLRWRAADGPHEAALP